MFLAIIWENRHGPTLASCQGTPPASPVDEPASPVDKPESPRRPPLPSGLRHFGTNAGPSGSATPTQQQWTC